MSLSHCCVNLCLSLLLLLHPSSLLSSNCASLHPWPCYLLEHLKETGVGGGGAGERERGGKNLAPLFLTSLLLHPQLPALHPVFPLCLFWLLCNKRKKPKTHSWRIRFTPTWHFIPHGCTHTRASTWTRKYTACTGSQCDERIKNAGLWIGWPFIVSELFEEASRPIKNVHREIKTKADNMKWDMEGTLPRIRKKSGLCIAGIPPPPSLFLTSFSFRSQCLCSLFPLQGH